MEPSINHSVYRGPDEKVSASAEPARSYQSLEDNGEAVDLGVSSAAKYLAQDG